VWRSWIAGPRSRRHRAARRGPAIGAMTRLQELVDSDDVPSVVREAARHELPSTLRAQSTIGGCIASGDPTVSCWRPCSSTTGESTAPRRRAASRSRSTSCSLSCRSLRKDHHGGQHRRARRVLADAHRQDPGDRPSSPSWHASSADGARGNHRRGSHPVLVNSTASARQPAPIWRWHGGERSARTFRLEPISDFRARASTAEPWHGSDITATEAISR